MPRGDAVGRLGSSGDGGSGATPAVPFASPRCHVLCFRVGFVFLVFSQWVLSGVGVGVEDGFVGGVLGLVGVFELEKRVVLGGLGLMGRRIEQPLYPG